VIYFVFTFITQSWCVCHSKRNQSVCTYCIDWNQTVHDYTGHRGRIVMVSGFTITYASCAYHWDKECQWLAAGRWFSLCTPISSTNKKKHITEILLKVVLNTITQILWGCYFPSLQVRWKSNYLWLDRKKSRDNFHWSG